MDGFVSVVGMTKGLATAKGNKTGFSSLGLGPLDCKLRLAVDDMLEMPLSFDCCC